jgi:Zn-dependent peptidase ImmA (M78 family)/DNA-binding XRE family transcriptional regulator
LTKVKLAESLGLATRTITRYEAGDISPPDETLHKISLLLGFPIEFFYGEDLKETLVETASFRALSKMTSAKRDSALAAGTLAFLLDDWINERFTLPTPAITDLRDETPESAASVLRNAWGIGEKPIKNMIHLLESKGIRVYSLAEDTLQVDAYSCWHEGRPFVFLNTKKSSERSRFDAAHELGHLVLHKHGPPSGNNAEKEADSFASAFLMPESSVRASCPRVPTLKQLIQLKHYWIVSVSALAYRLHALGLLSDWHYRTLAVELSEKGYRVNEPEPGQRETSQVLAKVLAALRDDDISISNVAKDLNISTNELSKLLFGIVPVGIAGGNSGATGTSNAKLKIIK